MHNNGSNKIEFYFILLAVFLDVALYSGDFGHVDDGREECYGIVNIKPLRSLLTSICARRGAALIWIIRWEFTIQIANLSL